MSTYSAGGSGYNPNYKPFIFLTLCMILTLCTGYIETIYERSTDINLSEGNGILLSTMTSVSKCVSPVKSKHTLFPRLQGYGRSESSLFICMSLICPWLIIILLLSEPLYLENMNGKLLLSGVRLLSSIIMSTDLLTVSCPCL